MIKLSGEDLTFANDKPGAGFSATFRSVGRDIHNEAGRVTSTRPASFVISASASSSDPGAGQRYADNEAHVRLVRLPLLQRVDERAQDVLGRGVPTGGDAVEDGALELRGEGERHALLL